MALIKNFIYCLNVNTTADGRTDIVGVLNAMRPEYIPGLFSFSINFSILNLKEGEHYATIRFKNSDGDIVSSIEEVKIEYKKDEDSNLPSEYLGINVAAGLQNVNLKKSGMYYTQVMLDGEDLGEYDIYIKGKNE